MQISFTFRFGDPRVWGQPVRDLYFKLGRHCYVHQIVRRPGGFVFVVPGFCLTFTRLL